MEGKKTPTLSEWACEKVGGLSTDEVYGIQYPLDISKVSEVYDQAFERFQPLVKIGKRKFAGGYLRNTAKDKETIIEHAQLLSPKFNAFINDFIACCAEPVFASSGMGNKCLIKSGDGLDFKLKYKNADQIRDMVRTSIICPSITSLEATIRCFIEYCKASGLDFCNCNFYDNVARFGGTDRADVNHPFGYVGVHFDIAFILDDIISKSDEGSNDCADVKVTFPNTATEVSTPGQTTFETEVADTNAKSPTILMAEVQFHPSTIYDGTATCLKERQHAAYRAFHMKTAQQDEAIALKTRAAIEMQYAYALSVTPL